MGGQKPLACLNVVFLRLVVEKVLRSVDPETLLIVWLASQWKNSRQKSFIFPIFGQTLVLDHNWQIFYISGQTSGPYRSTLLSNNVANLGFWKIWPRLHHRSDNCIIIPRKFRFEEKEGVLLSSTISSLFSFY